MPNVAAALGEGKVNAEHVDALAQAARDTTPREVDADETLLDRVAGSPADLARRKIREWTRERQDPADIDAAHRRARQRRSLKIFPVEDNTMLRALLDTDTVTGADFQAQILDITKRLFEADNKLDESQRRSWSQCCHDALMILTGIQAPPACLIATTNHNPTTPPENSGDGLHNPTTPANDNSLTLPGLPNGDGLAPPGVPAGDALTLPGLPAGDAWPPEDSNGGSSDACASGSALGWRCAVGAAQTPTAPPSRDPRAYRQNHRSRPSRPVRHPRNRTHPQNRTRTHRLQLRTLRHLVVRQRTAPTTRTRPPRRKRRPMASPARTRPTLRTMRHTRPKMPSTPHPTLANQRTHQHQQPRPNLRRLPPPSPRPMPHTTPPPQRRLDHPPRPHHDPRPTTQPQPNQPQPGQSTNTHPEPPQKHKPATSRPTRPLPKRTSITTNYTSTAKRQAHETCDEEARDRPTSGADTMNHPASDSSAPAGSDLGGDSRYSCAQAGTGRELLGSDLV